VIGRKVTKGMIQASEFPLAIYVTNVITLRAAEKATHVHTS
jgi:hypothetical protein